MLEPDLHINLYISAEVVRMACATMGFTVAVWGMVKIIALLVRNAEIQQAKEDGRL